MDCPACGKRLFPFTRISVACFYCGHQQAKPGHEEDFERMMEAARATDTDDVPIFDFD